MPTLEESWISIAEALGYRSEEEMLLDLYVQQQLSLNAIAKMLGYSAFNVRRRLIFAGVELRGRGGPNNRGHRRLVEIKDIELFDESEGWLPRLCAKYDVCPATVFGERRLRRALRKKEEEQHELRTHLSDSVSGNVED